MPNNRNGQQYPALADKARTGVNRFLVGRLATAGLRTASQLINDVEHRVLQVVKDKLEAVEGQTDGLPEALRSGSNSVAVQLLRPDPNQLLAELHQRSIHQTYESAQDDLLRSLTLQLVPDELRVLASLSDGDKHPVCHLEAISRLGKSVYRARSFLSRTPQESGIMLPSRAPTYLQHLLSLGLLEAGPELKPEQTKYDTIENGLEIRSVVAELEASPGLKPRFQRFSLGLSDMGRWFWQSSLAARESQ
ncbi:MAG: hypothetical protein R3175_17050 [Marinobacter sp.]|uniref:Abi-alpha family protein n=1 Tax=Marinobacter sp. TaxID=50741 RepID=UPI00299EFFCF|nr:hypothetical protein [Marinobacter sp.]MDX1757767.1 hypothetical protein [Marinobacter sp.]